MLATISTVIALLLGYLLLTLAIKQAYRAPRIEESGTPADFGLPYKSLTIQTKNNKKLFAWYIPASHNKNGPGVVAIHGWGGNAEHMLPFAKQLHQNGYAALLLDARNHGKSDADTFSSLPRFAEDLEQGYDWLAARSEIDPNRIALLGHSVGAGAALLVATRRKGVAAIISIAAFAHPETLMRRQMQTHHIPYLPLGWAALKYIEHTIGMRYDEIAPVNTIRNIYCPVLLVHGSDDRSIPIADAKAIYHRRAHHKVELFIIQGADHGSVEHIESQSVKLIDFLKRSLK